jgi:hypothetical protein
MTWQAHAGLAPQSERCNFCISARRSRPLLPTSSIKTPPKKVPSSGYSRSTPKRHYGGNWPQERSQKHNAVQAEYDRLARRWAGPRPLKSSSTEVCLQRLCQGSTRSRNFSTRWLRVQRLPDRPDVEALRIGRIVRAVTALGQGQEPAASGVQQGDGADQKR